MPIPIRIALTFLILVPLAIQLPSQSVTLALLGDVMLGRGVAQAYSSEEVEANSLSYLKPFLLKADLALANLESPLTTTPLKSYTPYDLRASPNSSRILKLSGLDLISLANNHALDSGEFGRQETAANLRGQGLIPLGLNDDPIFLKVNGIELAFFALEDLSYPLNLPVVLESIRDAMMQGNIVVVSIHWGSEYRPGPDARQKDLAKNFADAGASLICGHHPHVLQPVEWIEGDQLTFPTLVIYSLGNALSDQPTPPGARQGALLTVQLTREGIQELHALPFEIDTQRAQIKPANPETYNSIFHRLALPAIQSLNSPSAPP